MGVEATLICVDNSEYSRNGDFSPSRLAAQVDASGLIASAKLSEHFENTVGIVCFAGRGSRLIAAPSNDLGTFLSGLQLVTPYGESEFIKGIQTAQLALKHRLNKSQQQRIICFFASPIKEDRTHYVMLGKLLKKNNVSIDIINLCNDVATEEKLAALHAAVNNNDTSHYLHCKAGGDMLLSEMILNSPIMQGTDVGGMAAGYNSNLGDFGVDPEMDPQLYMALRMSLEQEEERVRKETAKHAANNGAEHPTQTLTIADVENQIKDMAAIQIVPLPRVMEMVMTSEGNPELLESLIYSLPEVDLEDERFKELVDKLKELLPMLPLG
ncbi:26S PROTEASOME NON-ATPASE REGULATORY SUBUNIT 4 containing protein,putative [Babesia bigemina]|uniref:26S PROTEASOME NON-ATPASE REGULATORY SUBUNIT 4 containing protein,putative n=1 Tax=Babesia bigemina TaxID=5866 RepID=A0A061D381_BABBI|nr:26S PROTEASOME NON-ATPASE REGULATORY SUBUNIT 4 containing protein,putative [Babesia bigemina]CDR95063.1 26S PROTEASOME NON-ATPASE REGULATORY SUBUNIT 4 containing protein,putative [Babesia bigemina]|eukprot:XP_012767249.1 26S PROTEASOME NON-ATPASE REGULATORY SUBUNIT 4 containing protein,putative [Babesia bigemina]